MFQIALILASLTGTFAEIDPEILASTIGQVLYQRRISDFKSRNDLKVMVPLSFLEERLLCDKKPDKHHKPGLTGLHTIDVHKPTLPHHKPHGIKDYDILQSILHKPYYVISGIKESLNPYHELSSKPSHDHHELSLHKPSHDHHNHELSLHKPSHDHHNHELSSHKPSHDHQTYKPDILSIKPYHDHEEIIHGIKDHVQSLLHKPIHAISGIKETLKPHHEDLTVHKPGFKETKPVDDRELAIEEEKEATTLETTTKRAVRRRKPSTTQENPFWLNIFTTQRPINKKREATRKGTADKKLKESPQTDETRVNKKEN